MQPRLRRVYFGTALAAVPIVVAVSASIAQPASPVPAAAAAVEDASAPAAPLDPAEVARRARVYARVGSRTITVGDLEDAVRAQTPYQRELYRTEPARLRELADTLVQLEVLAAEAKRRHLERSANVRAVVDGNLVQLFVHDVIDTRIPPESVPDAEIAAHYAAHQDEYARPAMARANHVLLADETAARELAAACADMDVAAFRQRARDTSLDEETKQSGGDLRYFTADGRPMGHEGRPIARELVDAAFALTEVGSCSAVPVRIGERFSVVKLTGRRTAEVTSLEAATDGIRRRLWRERRDAELDRVVTAARARFPVTRRDELVRLVPVAEPTSAEAVHQHGEPEDTHLNEGAGASMR